MKPCPWCGGTEINVHEGSTFRWMVAECSCGARAPEVRVQTLGVVVRDQAIEEGRSKAFAEWNNRHGGTAT